MNSKQTKTNSETLSSLKDFAQHADYSYINTLNRDPEATENGIDHDPRQVFSGHYVPVVPTPIDDPEYVSHSKDFFAELGLADSLAESTDFVKMFSGDLSAVPEPLGKLGWATGYALSIYGTEYIQQCPFHTGNGYGDGRAVSVFEGVLSGKRWEMQLKGGGRTPYCRGGDGRAVLRSSVREFLAQEHMHALGIPTSRSLSFYASKTETVNRPWYSEGSYSEEPDDFIAETVAISTRVAPSFIRVGQVELFARRTRKGEYESAKEELEKLVLHVIDREYSDELDSELSTPEKVLALARLFRGRLTSLVASWIRVGYCQGNFNGDNCSVGGYTLDYGPFGFMDVFHPYYQPWTGGGRHFSFMNQPNAALKNFGMFCASLRHLLNPDSDELDALEEVQSGFALEMNSQIDIMWASKLGLSRLKSESDKELCKTLVGELQSLMIETQVDYTLLFRELSYIPQEIESLKKSFYPTNASHSQELEKGWQEWLDKWNSLLNHLSEDRIMTTELKEEISEKMKSVNPKYILREWIVIPAYKKAAEGDYSLVRELQEVMNQPYDEQSKEVEEKYYKLKANEYFEMGGVSHLSCSS